MNEEFESLELDGLEFDEIEKAKGGAKYEFPTITLGEYTLYFNAAFSKFFEDVEYVKFKASTEYVLIEPAKKRDRSTFRVNRWTHAMRGTAYPANLKEKKIKRGIYKIYRYKDGFAFKRYEPLEVYGG